MPIFTCPECGFSKSVPEAAIGKKAKCPKCQSIVVIAAVEEPAEQPEKAEPTEPTETTEPENSKSDESREPAFVGRSLHCDDQNSSSQTDHEPEYDQPEASDSTTEQQTEIDDQPDEGIPNNVDNLDAPPEPNQHESEQVEVEDFPRPVQKIETKWLVALAGVGLVFVAAATLFSFNMINLALLCFGVGIIAIVGLAAAFVFLGS
ncbi:MAG: hypothetical protein AAGA30_17260 [Planctomycetota bacterium]